MCAFVGRNLDEIVVTSARQKLTPEQLAREPHAGGLFRLRPGVPGRAETVHDAMILAAGTTA